MAIDFSQLVTLRKPEQVKVTIADASKQVRARALYAERQACRESLAQFVKSSWPILEESGIQLEWDTVHTVIATAAQRVAMDMIAGVTYGTKRVLKDVVLNVPPGSLKTRIVSTCLLPWIWLRAPWVRAASLSCNPRIPIKTSLDALKLITSEWYQAFKPDFSVRSEAVTDIMLSSGGERRAQSLQAAIVGSRYDLLLIDDPNDPTDTPEGHRAANRHYEVAHERVNDKRVSARICIQQRVAPNDWTARFANPKFWSKIVIPVMQTQFAIEQNKAHAPKWYREWRKIGQPITPARFPDLDALRAEAGDNWSTWWDQNPRRDEHAFFPRDKWCWFSFTGAATPGARPKGCSQEPPRHITGFDYIAVSVDTTFKNTATSDTCAIAVIGALGAERFVIDVVAKRMDFDEARSTIRSLCTRYSPQHIWIEDTANGPAIINELKNEFYGVEPVKPEGGKSARAQVSKPPHQAGQCYLLDDAHWAPAFVGELETFPYGEFDDQVDAFTQAIVKSKPTTANNDFFALAGYRPK